MNREIEEIRKQSGMSQVEFAKYLGTARRTYLNRLNGDHPRWFLEEIVKIAELNEGEVIAVADGKRYAIKVEPVD